MKIQIRKILVLSVALIMIIGTVLPVLKMTVHAAATKVMMFEAAETSVSPHASESYDVTYTTADYNSGTGKMVQLKLTSAGENYKSDWNRMNGVAAVFSNFNSECGWGSVNTATYASGVFRFWVKSPVAMRFTVALQENITWDFYLCQVEITSEQIGKFVHIDVPVSSFKKSTNSIYTDSVTETITSGQINNIYVTCLRNNTQWISAGQTLELGSLEFWNSQPPEPDTNEEPPVNEATLVDSTEAISGIYGVKTDSGYENIVYYDVVYQDQAEYDGASDKTAAVYTLTEGGTSVSNPRMQIDIRNNAAGWKSWYIDDYPTGYLRFWIKSDKALGLGITIQETSSVNASADYSLTLEESQLGKFVPVDIPLSEFQSIAVAENSRVNKIWINPQLSDTKLAVGESVMLGRLEYWSGKPPVSDDETPPPPDNPPPDTDDPPILPPQPTQSVLLYSNLADHTDMWSDVWSGNGAPMNMTIEGLSEDNPLRSLYTSVAKFTLKPEMADTYLNSGSDFKYIRIGRLIGTAAANLNDYAQSGTLRLRLAATKDISFSVGVLDVNYIGTFVDKSITSDSGYTVVDIPLSSFAESSADMSAVREVRLRPVAGTTADTNKFLSAGESLYILGLEIWTGTPKDRVGEDPELPEENDKDDKFVVNTDTKGSEKLFETDFITTTAWSDDFNDNKGADRTVSLETANLDSSDPYFKYFHTVLNVSLNAGKEKGYYQKNYPIYFFGSTVYDTIKYERIPIDVSSALKTGTLRFYISVPRDMDINIGVTDSKWNSVMVKRTIKKSTGLTEISIPLSELAAYAKNVDFSKIVQIRMKPIDGANEENGLFLKAGENIVLGPLQIWSKGAANIELPGAYDNLPAQNTEATKKIFETEYLKKNCWSDDWNNGGKRSINVDTVMLDSDDENYYKFKRAAAISLSADKIEDYYKSPYSVAFFGQNGASDILPYIMNGTIRFWVKSTKTLTVDIAVVDSEYHIVKIPIELSKSDQYTEVKIPLKDFYYSTWEKGTVFDWNAFSHIRMYPSSDATAKNGLFLSTGDTITFGYMQLWTGEAPEPSAEEIDVTRTFLDYISGAFIKDYDLSLLEGTELRYFSISDKGELDTLKKLMGDKRKLVCAYGLYVITGGAKNDYSLDKVEIFLPLCDDFDVENVKFAIMNDKYEFIAVDTRIEGDYLVVSTSDFGKLIVYTGEAYTKTLKSALSSKVGVTVKEPIESNGTVLYISLMVTAGAVLVIGGAIITAVILKKKTSK